MSDDKGRLSLAAAMHTFLISTDIPGDRQIVINLPPDISPGKADLLVVVVPHDQRAGVTSSSSGKFRQLRGALHSGDPEAADNQRIDADLAAEYRGAYVRQNVEEQIVLLDTSGLLCYLDADEARHAIATRYFDDAPFRFTHNYVLAEFVALAQARRLPRKESLALVAAATTDDEVEV